MTTSSMGYKSSVESPSEFSLFVQKQLRKISWTNDPVLEADLKASLERAIKDQDQWNQDIAAQRGRVEKGNYVMTKPTDETKPIKDRLVDLLIQGAVLPERYVSGKDMWGRVRSKTSSPTIQDQFLKLAKKASKELMQEVMEEYKDRLEEIQDQDEGLNTNRQVDDLDLKYEIYHTESLEEEFKAHKAHFMGAWKSACAAQDRHNRMVMRLVLVDRLRAEGIEAEVTDDQLENLEEGQVPSVSEIARKDKEINQKNNASFFRKRLEEKAVFLRDMCFKAERDETYKKLVILMANRSKVWCEARFKDPAPYSKRAVNALYNEALHCLVALGVYQAAFTRKEWNPTTKKFDGPECSFFTKSTQETMVEMKTGKDWMLEVQSGYYEQEKLGKVPVRGSFID